MHRFLTDAIEFMPILLLGVRNTIIVTLGSLALSTVLGLLWALMRVSGIRALAAIAVVVVNVIRGIPIIVQLFYIYFVLPDFGITLSALEAAHSIGMGWTLTMRRVVLPQAVGIMLPPYGNIMIMMLKDSSQASTITVGELALQGKLIASSTFKNTTVFTLVAVLYLVMSVPLMVLVSWLERRAGRK
jgi:polar amino acid transport system permease protein